MPITKTQALAVSEDLRTTIDEVLAKHGLAPNPMVRVTYGDQLRITITAAALEVDADTGVNTASAEAVAYQRYHASYGLKGDLLGKKVTLRGQEYTFVGIALKRKKYPIMVQDANGKTMLFSTDVVRHLNATTPGDAPRAAWEDAVAAAYRDATGHEFTGGAQ